MTARKEHRERERERENGSRPAWAKLSKELPSMEKKAGCGSVCLPSLHQRKYNIGGLWSRLAWAKGKNLSPRYPEQKWLKVWIKWWSACLASMKP
jgi:hypothetical protein